MRRVCPLISISCRSRNRRVVNSIKTSGARCVRRRCRAPASTGAGSQSPNRSREAAALVVDVHVATTVIRARHVEADPHGVESSYCPIVAAQRGGGRIASNAQRRRGRITKYRGGSVLGDPPGQNGPPSFCSPIGGRITDHFYGSLFHIGEEGIGLCLCRLPPAWAPRCAQQATARSQGRDVGRSVGTPTHPPVNRAALRTDF